MEYINHLKIKIAYYCARLLGGFLLKEVGVVGIKHVFISCNTLKINFTSKAISLSHSLYGKLNYKGQIDKAIYKKHDLKSTEE